MGVISISNDKKVVWTKFEQIPLENKSFEIFIPETLDSRPTFGKFALTAFREPKSTYLFYNHIFFCFKTFIFSWKTEKISNTKKKLWLLEVTVKIFLELVLFNEVSIFLIFQKLYFWVAGTSRMEKIYLYAKIQSRTFKIVRLRTFFSASTRA